MISSVCCSYNLRVQSFKWIQIKFDSSVEQKVELSFSVVDKNEEQKKVEKKDEWTKWTRETLRANEKKKEGEQSKQNSRAIDFDIVITRVFLCARI